MAKSEVMNSCPELADRRKIIPKIPSCRFDSIKSICKSWTIALRTKKPLEAKLSAEVLIWFMRRRVQEDKKNNTIPATSQMIGIVLPKDKEKILCLKSILLRHRFLVKSFS